MGIHPLGDVAQGVITDNTLITNPLLPLRQRGFTLELQQTGNLSHLAEQQSQSHGPGRNLGMRTRIGKGSGQEPELEELLSIPLKALEFLEIGFSQGATFPRAEATQIKCQTKCIPLSSDLT